MKLITLEVTETYQHMEALSAITVSKAVFWLRLKTQRTAQSDVNAALAFSSHHSCVTGDVTALQQLSQTPHLSAALGAL